MAFSDKRITARRDWPRPAEAAWAELKGASSSVVCDGQGRRGALPAAIRPVTAATAFAGPALTVQCRPRDNVAALAALQWVRSGDVMVLGNDGHDGAALIGANFVALARARGVAAIVCDGPARDIDDLDSLGIPVFSRGVMPGGPFKTGPGLIGFPVPIGPVVVASGDIVVGDRDGIVVVRQDEIAVAVAGHRAIRARESAMAATIGQGDLPDWLRETISAIGVDVVD